MRRLLYALIWIAVYLLLVLAPLLVLMIGPERPGRETWREFSVALGFVGMSMMGLQFLLTARFRTVVRPYGIDVVYHFHRQISLLAIIVILLHPITLFIFSPGLLNLLNPLTAPARVIYGEVSILLFLLIIFLSMRRLNIKLSYEPWRLTHGMLATAALVLGMLHILGVGYYIDTPAKQVLWVTMAIFWIGALLYVRIVKPLILLRRPYLVEEVRAERGDSYTLRFTPEGHKGLRFRPGQFAWLTIRHSPLTIHEHPFSFSSSAMENSHVELTVKELGDFTSRIKSIQPGTRAYLDGPYGAFTIDHHHHAPGNVFLGGGVGITPIMSMLRTLADRRDQRPVVLFYGSRTYDDMTFREQIDALQERLNLRLIYVLEEPPEDWQGPTGFITPDLIAQNLPENRYELMYFVCGPEPMMDAIESALEALGIPDEQVTAERFNFV